MPANPKAHEPSMEEILASIRRIIADDEMPPVPPELHQTPQSSAREVPARGRWREEPRHGAPRPAAPQDTVVPHPTVRAASDAIPAGRPADGHEPRPRAPMAERAFAHAPAADPRRPAASGASPRHDGRDEDGRDEDYPSVAREAAAPPVADGRSRLVEAELARGAAVIAAREVAAREMAAREEVEREVARADERWRTVPSPPARERTMPPRMPAPGIGPMKPTVAAPAHEGPARRDDAEAAERPAATEPEPAPPAGRKNLLSPAVDAAVASSFRSLGDMVLPRHDRTVEDLVKEILRPMLKDWLDRNLPEIVERLVQAEIERVSRAGR